MPFGLAALVAPARLRSGGQIDLLNPVLAGGVAALALALWRKTVLGPLVLGFAVTTVLGLL